MSAGSAMLRLMDEITPIAGYARVVVDLPTRALDAPLDYAVPSALDARAVTGAPVLLPLGAGAAIGFVVGRMAETEFQDVRPIADVLGPAMFSPGAVRTAGWIAQEYHAPLAEALRLFLPPGGAPTLQRGWRDVETGETIWDDDLSPAESRRLARRNRARSAERTYRLKPPAARPATERVVSLVAGATFAPAANATLQRAVLDALVAGPVTAPELRAALGHVDGALRRLEELGVVKVEERRRVRGPDARAYAAPRHERLSEGQADALEAIRTASPGDVVLCDGVTGSGKTEVYLRAIEDAVAGGGRAIVLVPEISLTPQTVGRFRSRFGDRVAVLHSRLSPGERFDQWQLVMEGVVDVVVGARSALFAPVEGLRLVIIDEEHEPSYKQSSTPRYHAREVAETICRDRGAVLVLGSATPSMESLHRAETGRYRRIALPERVGGGRPPAVTIVDMGAEFSDGHRSMFSRPLLEGLGRVAEDGAKAVLFLNRRGYASFLLCRECGFVPRCESCSVSLTYHDTTRTLVCHHCGATHPAPVTCPRCGSAYLRRFGAGTQRVEEELASLFPALPVVRMDADTTTGKGGHERALARFEATGSGVLLGTQMVAKGLDYPDVVLVGVLNADTTLHVPDFRAAERTFQLLEQVSGRAGRGEAPGTVVIQTYWPEHPAIRAVAERDPGLLLQSEQADRRPLGYPPFGRLCNVIVTSGALREARAASAEVARALAAGLPDDWTVIGPAPAPLARLKGRHRWHVLVKASPDAPVAAAVGPVVDAIRVPEGTSVVVDVDPIELV